MAKVAVVFHSGYGHTAQMAKAVARGAESVAGTEVTLISVEEVPAKWDVLDGADAIIFGCPTYMGSMSAPFKTFIDSASGRWFKQAWKDKLAAGFTNSGSFSGDKYNTLIALFTNAMQHSMVWVSLGLLPAQGKDVNGPTSTDLNRLGSFSGAMSQSGQFPPETAPPEGDLKTGEHLGHRVATFAATWAPPKAV